MKRSVVLAVMLSVLYVSAKCVLAAESENTTANRGNEGLYANPVLDVDNALADPTVIRAGGVYYLYPTSDLKGYDVYTSTDLVNWKLHGQAFAAPEGGAWAPDVFYNARGDGKFYMYYTMNSPAPRKKVGVAVSGSPLGPFIDRGLLFDFDAIDAHLFQDDDGAMFLYYVERRTSCINVQPMSDPLHKKGNPKTVVCPSASWEGVVAEGPWMLKHNETYYLMYSGNFFNTSKYAVGYATAKSPVGPFRKYSGNPIASSGGGVFGPGHHCVVEGPRGGLWMVYHQKVVEIADGKRFIAIDPLWFDEKGVIHTRTTRGTEQEAP